jgi:hypothetical protein
MLAKRGRGLEALAALRWFTPAGQDETASPGSIGAFSPTAGKDEPQHRIGAALQA